jgi:hypothetical protein
VDTESIKTAGITPESTAQETTTTETQPKETSGVEFSGETAKKDANGVETGTEPPKPAYKPDYKLKVYHQDMELKDEFLKGLMKDAETEKKVKEIAQKSEGFEVIKGWLEESRNKHDEYYKASQPIVDYYNEASKILAKKDLGGFFEHIGIPEDEILKYAIALAEERQLDPESRRQVAEQRQLAKQKEQLESQNQALMQQQYQQTVQYRNQELQWMLARPEVAQAMKAFDATNGQNAFLELVREVGLAHYAQTGGREDLTPEQAIQKVMTRFGGFFKQGETSQMASPQASQTVTPDSKPPVIPNVSGKATSPVRKKPSSINDLKKRYEELSSS